MKDKRTRSLIILSLVVFIFLYSSSVVKENFNNRTFGESGTQAIIALGDNYTPFIAKPPRKNFVHRNNFVPLCFVGFNSFIYIKMVILACFMTSSFIRDIRKGIMELIPAHFYGSKYDMGAIFS